MKAFPHWRAVGQAMRWARRQADITVDTITIVDLAKVTSNRWRTVPNGTQVVARHARGFERVDVEITRRYLDLTFYAVRDAAEVLRVLAALHLIPTSLAYVPEERYGRCERCGRLAQWAPPSELWPGRWFHYRRIHFNGDPHLAEVTE